MQKVSQRTTPTPPRLELRRTPNHLLAQAQKVGEKPTQHEGERKTKNHIAATTRHTKLNYNLQTKSDLETILHLLQIIHNIIHRAIEKRRRRSDP